MAGTAEQIHKITTEEVRNVSVDLSGFLDSAEVLAAPLVMTSDDEVTIDNEQINSAALTINGASVAIGKAVQFQVSCATVGVYTIEIKVNTDDSQTIEANLTLKVVATAFSD